MSSKGHKESKNKPVVVVERAWGGTVPVISKGNAKTLCVCGGVCVCLSMTYPSLAVYSGGVTPVPDHPQGELNLLSSPAVAAPNEGLKSSSLKTYVEKGNTL